MAGPMRIRASMMDDKVEVRVLMSHEMETGQRRDSSGNIIPAHFIRNVAIAHAGKTVLSAQWGPAISKNPFTHFRFRGGKPGDKVTISWVDNKGERRLDEAVVVGG